MNNHIRNEWDNYPQVKIPEPIFKMLLNHFFYDKLGLEEPNKAEEMMIKDYLFKKLNNRVNREKWIQEYVKKD